MAILVAGGTGQVGSAATRALSEAGASVRVLTRDVSSEKARSLADLLGVTLVQGDYGDAASLSAALDGVQAAFLGCSNFEGQAAAEKAFIDAAAASETCGYVVKLGTCGVYTGAESPIQYACYHAEIEEHLASSSLQWTVLRPNDFMQNHMGDIFGTLPHGMIAYPALTSSEATIVDTRDVGALAATLLLEPIEARSRHASQKYDVCGPGPVSFERLAELYTVALGREIKAVQVSPEEWTANAEKAGFPAWLAKAVSVNFAEYWGLGKLNYASSEAVLEVCAPKRSMEDWIAEHAKLSPPPPSV